MEKIKGAQIANAQYQVYSMEKLLDRATIDYEILMDKVAMLKDYYNCELEHQRREFQAELDRQAQRYSESESDHEDYLNSDIEKRKPKRVVVKPIKKPKKEKVVAWLPTRRVDLSPFELPALSNSE